MKSSPEYRYVVFPKAQIELLDAYEWYGSRSLVAAVGMRAEVEQGLKAICLNPFRWKTAQSDYREFMLKKYPYSIVYSVNEEEKLVVVISVFHHKRHPKRKFKS